MIVKLIQNIAFVYILMSTVTADDFCTDPKPEAGYSVYNLADHLVIVSHYTTNGTHTDKYWLFDPSAKTMTKCNTIDEIMPAMNLGVTFGGLLFAITFKANVCSEASVECVNSHKLDNLVIVHGSGVDKTNGQPIDFKSYKIDSNGGVVAIGSAGDMPFSWEPSGNISGTGILPYVDPLKKGYLSAAYDRTNQRMVAVTDNIQDQRDFRLWHRTLTESGPPGHWITGLSFAFKGLFVMNDILYAIEPIDNDILSVDKVMAVSPAGTIKKFFVDCKNNTTDSPIGVSTNSPVGNSTHAVTTDTISPDINDTSVSETIVDQQSTTTTSTAHPVTTKKSDTFIGSVWFYVIILVVILVIIGVSVAALIAFVSTRHPERDQSSQSKKSKTLSPKKSKTLSPKKSVSPTGEQKTGPTVRSFNTADGPTV